MSQEIVLLILPKKIKGDSQISRGMEYWELRQIIGYKLEVDFLVVFFFSLFLSQFFFSLIVSRLSRICVEISITRRVHSFRNRIALVNYIPRS